MARRYGRHAAEPLTRGLRPGGRSARVVEVVLAATRAELARAGYSRLSVEAVAERAHVNKTTVYRRWPTKASLVVAAVTAVLVVEDGPQRESLRDDLLFLARWLAAWMETPEGWGVTRALFAETDEAEVQVLSRTARLKVRERWEAAVRRSMARGEVPADTDVSLVVEVTMAAVLDAFVHVTHVVDERFLEAVVRLVVTGALHGGAVPPR
ncbi:MAG TPA: TetR/AcrR family transcriptional regulator [Anaeromyxobacter sp.]|nr:TetR/AcrR family transcriptional regulator [Anaeromyxobacter sp.]